MGLLRFFPCQMFLPAAFALVAANPALAAQAQTQQWAEPARTEQWSASPGALSSATPYSATQAASDNRPKAEPSAACARNAKVEVLYAGKWYPAKILDGPDRMGTCLVSYDGYGSNWDEWVNQSRIRSPGQQAAETPRPSGQQAAATSRPGATKPDSSATTASAAQGKLPTGTYSCYTYDSGQMNYTYTDIVIRGDGRYAVGSKEGRYTLAQNGAMTFTGPLSNAKGTLAKTAKPQINLVFNGDAWSSMACSRAQ